MSHLEELIQQYCPDGVEWKKLGDICQVTSGNTAPQNPDLFIEGKYPFIRTSDVGKVHRSVDFTTCADFLNDQGAKGLKLFPKGAILIPKSGASTLLDHRVRLGIDAYVVSHLAVLIPIERIICSRYLYYISTTLSSKQWVEDESYPSVTTKKIALTEIPVPPMPVQEEIVRILDAMTALTAELQAELQARRAQYEYYRDSLLSFDKVDSSMGGGHVEWKKLGDIATQWYRGAGIKRDEITMSGKPCIRYGEIHTTYNIWFDKCVSHTDESLQTTKKYADSGDILFAITSEDIPFIGNCVAYIGNERIMVGGDIVVMKHNQNPRFLAYALSTSDAVIQKGKGKVKSKVVHTSVPSLQEIVIPIPPLSEQQRIVDLLDRFYTLATDLTQGLPAEIEARQKQYEYYRDKLLTFKRITA